MFTTRRLVTTIAAMAAIALGLALVPAVPASSAQFAGVNGQIQYSVVSLAGSSITASIHLINADGTGDQTLIANGWYGSQNANATKLTYVTSAPSGVSNELRVANFDGTGDTLVSTAPAGRAYNSTSMSADGTKIAFIERPNGVPGNTDIMVINTDGTGLTNITNGAATGVNYVQFSPDGTQLSFHATVSTISQVFTVPATGGAATQITTGAGARSASWLPNGKMLYRSSNSEIVRMDADGTNAAVLLSAASLNLANLDWPVASPDGTKMTFSASTQGGPLSLWVANIDGTNPVLIRDASIAAPNTDYALAIWSSPGGSIPTSTTVPAADPVGPTFAG